jgi:hypothetical protein
MGVAIAGTPMSQQKKFAEGRAERLAFSFLLYFFFTKAKAKPKASSRWGGGQEQLIHEGLSSA